MQLQCPRCRHVLDFTGPQPLFCAYCGSALAETEAASSPGGDSEAATLPPPAARAASSKASTLPSPLSTEGELEAAPAAVGGYRLLRRLGSGGMGAVFEAEDVASGMRVALKLISAGFAASKDAVERFRQEGRLASQIIHPRCVFVLAADQESGRPYIVMELMPGSTLQDLVRDRGPLPVPQAVAKTLDVIDGLQEAHRLGVIHRDVKPSNCFLEANGRVKVGDFGLAKSLVQESHLTKSGAFLGTVLFASPEQIRKDPLNQQTDVYSVAATLYFLLTGRAPHQTGDPSATLARIVSDPAPPLRSLRPGIPVELDHVVLRGLERNSEERWQNLEVFREALRPFIAGQTVLAGLGIRFAAFMVDYVILSLVKLLLMALVLSARDFGELRQLSPARTLAMMGLEFLAWLLCFALPEGRWGSSPGKHMLGLQVSKVFSHDLPGWGRALLRTTVFYGLFTLGVWPFAVLLAVRPLQQDSWGSNLLLSLVPLLGQAVGIGLALSTMRVRNGLRGLHEFASGTCVIRPPEPEKRVTLGHCPLELDLSHPEGLPERIGPFAIRGALCWTGAVDVLVGEDRALGRKVLLWLRPLAWPPLPFARRAVSRVTRLRWLAWGKQADWQWDALLAPSGCALTTLVKVQGKLPWWEGRKILEQLAEELASASAEGSLPAGLAVDQVWIQAHGRVLLLDGSWTDPSPDALPPVAGSEMGGSPVGKDRELGQAAPSGSDPIQARALSLLGQTAVLALEASERPLDGAAVAVRAPLPVHAQRLMGRLLQGPGSYAGVEEFQKDLAATRDRPTEVTVARRAAHLAVLTVVLLLGLGNMVGAWMVRELPMLFGFSIHRKQAQVALQNLKLGASRDSLLASLSAVPLLPVYAQLQSAQDERLCEQLEESLKRAQKGQEDLLNDYSWFKSANAHVLRGEFEQALDAKLGAQEPSLLQVPANFRQRAREATQERSIARLVDAFVLDSLPAQLLGWSILAWPALWVVWAFLTRGGWTFRLLGLTLCRADGRPATRGQCLWRALLVWAPVTALLVLSDGLLVSYWRVWDVEHPSPWAYPLSHASWWLAVGLLVSYVALALLSPARSLHDRLAGTYLVPR